MRATQTPCSSCLERNVVVTLAKSLGSISRAEIAELSWDRSDASLIVSYDR